MDNLKKWMANPAFFVVGYLVFMLATYILPYGGSNSAIVQGTASATGAPQAGHFRLLFWLHLGSIVALCLLTWLRGSHVDKAWISIFPIIAGVFDLTPGLSLIPLVPTAMHIAALVMGARGRTSPIVASTVSPSIAPERLVSTDKTTSHLPRPSSTLGEAPDQSAPFDPSPVPTSNTLPRSGTATPSQALTSDVVQAEDRDIDSAAKPVSRSLFCTKCGTRIDMSGAFCENCGAKLKA